MKILSVFNEKDLKILRKVSKNVVDLSTIRDLVFDMKEAMKNSGGIGISAVQVGVLKRVIVINTVHGDKVLINPEILEEEGKIISKEGCLSINGFYENVERSKTIVVKYINEKGDECMQGFRGIDSICIQHEIDHLNGVLFFDKVNFMAKKRFKKLLKEKKNENRK